MSSHTIHICLVAGYAYLVDDNVYSSTLPVAHTENRNCAAKAKHSCARHAFCIYYIFADSLILREH